MLKLLLNGSQKLGSVVQEHINILLGELNDVKCKAGTSSGASSSTANDSVVENEAADASKQEKLKEM